jgi:glycosyltransferase involved in cell wall biosynthesis
VKLASWIVTSHHRPELLRVTLGHLVNAIVPLGWQVEIVVVFHAGDEASATAAAPLASRVISSSAPHPSGKRNDALKHCQGELVMVTDDDDFQSLVRVVSACAAYEAGYKLSGIKEFRRLHLASGNVVRYCGRGDLGYERTGAPNLPPVTCGTARNYTRALLEQHHGWNAKLDKLEDHDLHRRIVKRRSGSDPGVAELDYSAAVADTTIICQHDTNICPRPEVKAGKVEVFGDYVLVGEGHWTQVPGFPIEVAAALRSIGKLA